MHCRCCTTADRILTSQSAFTVLYEIHSIRNSSRAGHDRLCVGSISGSAKFARGPQMIRIRASFLIAILSAAPLGFAQRGAPVEQQLTFTPYHANGIYDIGETVGWSVTPGPATPTYAYKWTIRRNNAVVLKAGKLDLSSGKDKIEITGDQPEMIYVAVEPSASLAAPAYTGGNTGRNNGLYAV